MTFDEVLQQPSDTYKLSKALEYLLFTIEEAETVEDIINSQEYKEAKDIIKYF